MKEFEYDQFVHGILEEEEISFADEHNFFEMKIEPFKTFTFLRDWFFRDRYNIQPVRSGISVDGDPFLVYKPKHHKKTDIKEIYIEIYDGSVGLTVSTPDWLFGNLVEEYTSLEELCKYFDNISEYLI